MKKDKLGLPLEYKKFPEYFDAHNVTDDTDLKNSMIESLLRNHGVKTVLDLTCGTGSQVFFLAKQGYKVVGADFSPALLKIARNKAKKEKVNLRFIDGDIRQIRVGKFDAVITIFNAIGHLTKLGFEKAIKNIHKNLKDDGIYVFDIFNLEAMTDKVVSDFSMHSHRVVEDVQIHNVQCSTIDRKNGLLTSYDNYTIQKNADKSVRINNKFSLQIYTAKELREMLFRNGFKTLNQCGIDGLEFVKNKTTSILTIAQKVYTKKQIS